MKTVSIEVKTPDGRDTTDVSILLEENRGAGGWNRVDGKDAVTNKGAVTMTVRPNQRIVIDAYPRPEMVYDAAQGASVNPKNQKNEEGRADTAAEAEQREKDDPRLKHIVDQENARLKKAEELQGEKVKPVGQATPPTSREAAVPSSGAGGMPLGNPETIKAQTAGGHQGTTPPANKPTTPAQTPGVSPFKTAAENEAAKNAGATSGASALDKK